MAQKLRLVPLFGTLDPAQNDIALGREFSIRNIKGLLTAECFTVWNGQLNEEELSDSLHWDICLVHEFTSDLAIGPDEQRITQPFIPPVSSSPS